MGHQAGTATQAVERVGGKFPDAPVAARRKGFKAELDDLRERMRKLGLGFEEIAGEIARRYRLRPREAYRLARGWTLEHAAARFNTLAAGEGTDPQARAALTGSRLSEWEHWPASGRKPSVYALVILAQMYQADVLRLLDLADHENLAARDRLALIRLQQPRAAGPFGEKLVALMDERELSLREVARRVPCSPAHLSNLAHGRAGVSGHLAGLLDRVLDAGGELAALAEPPEGEDKRAGARGQPSLGAGGLSLSLPYVPGRLVIEVSDPAGHTGQLTDSGADSEIADGRLALVPGTGGIGDGGMEVSGA